LAAHIALLSYTSLYIDQGLHTNFVSQIDGCWAEGRFAEGPG